MQRGLTLLDGALFFYEQSKPGCAKKLNKRTDTVQKSKTTSDVMLILKGTRTNLGYKCDRNGVSSEQEFVIIFNATSGGSNK